MTISLVGAAKGVSWSGRFLLTTQVEDFLDELYDADRESHRLVNQAILVLERNGPAEGRPLVAFDHGVPYRAILLVAGDKSGQWEKWYRTAIPMAEQLYDDYLVDREKEMGR